MDPNEMILVYVYSNHITLKHTDPWLPTFLPRNGSNSADDTLRRAGWVRATQWNPDPPRCYVKRMSRTEVTMAETAAKSSQGQLAARDTIVRILDDYGGGVDGKLHYDSCDESCRCLQDLAEAIVKELEIR